MNQHYLRDELYGLVREDPAIFDFLQAGALDGIWYWDLMRSEVEWYSPGFKALFGYDDDEVPNESSWWQDRIHPEDLELALANYTQHCADPNHLYDQVVRYRHKDGTTVWVRCRGLVIRDASGAPKRMLGAHTDVTALKEAELRNAAMVSELERSNAALLDFAHSVAHDFKSSLRGIRHLARWVGEDAGDSLSEAAAQHLQRLEAKVEGLTTHVQGILRFSEVGRCKETVEEVDLRELVLAVGDLVAPPPGFRIQGPSAPTVLFTPRGPFEQVLMNLVGNAVKHHDQPAGHAVVSAVVDGDWLEVSVADDGPGIPASQHEDVFRLFATLDADTDRGGVGLSLVKRLVQSVGGRISLESEPPTGTTFRFTWPRDWRDRWSAGHGSVSHGSSWGGR